MKRLLARAALPLLAAAALSVASLPAANADPSHGGSMRCNGPTWITPEISVKTCNEYFWWDWHASWSDRARVTVRNNAWYSVSVRPDLLAGGVTYVGNTVNVAPGTEYEAFGNDVLQLRVASQARGYIQALNWSTYTYSP